MSRWKESFEDGEFKASWEKLSDEILSIQEEDFELDIDHIAELARLKRVVSYLKGIINNLDIELVPASIFTQLTTNCSSASVALSSYITTKNLAELKKVNTFIDHILIVLKPYDSNEKGLSYEASQSLMAYKESFESSVTKFINELEIKKNEIDLTHKDMTELHCLYFEDLDERDSVKKQFSELLNSADQDFEKIHELYTDLFEGGLNSIETKIAQAKVDAEKNSDSVRQAYAAAKKDLEEIDTYYIKIMGEDNGEGKRSGGLKSEIEMRTADLETSRKRHKISYKALNEQIEKALPGATRAGLAVAFSNMKKSFDDPIKKNSRLFVFSMVALFLISLMSGVDSVSLSHIQFVKFTDIQSVFGAFFQRLPIILPLIWLAVFSSRRRSEAQRLQQEYAHKEALALSYQNFKISKFQKSIRSIRFRI